MENLKQLLQEYYPYFVADLSELPGLLPMALFVGLLGSVGVMFWYRGLTDRWQWRKWLPYFLFITYVAVVVQLTILSREPGSRADVPLNFGATWGLTIQSQVYVIENILLFIPFGILFPLIGRMAFWHCLSVALCCSVVLEGIQYFTRRGYFQLDDVVANLIGVCIGYAIVRLIYEYYSRYFEVEEQSLF